MTSSDSQQQGGVTKKTGYVLFMKFAEGSKSESMRPFLVTATETLRLHAEGDNPFINESLKSYHCSHCAVCGVLAENKLLRVEKSTRLQDPVGGDNEVRACPESEH